MRYSAKREGLGIRAQPNPTNGDAIRFHSFRRSYKICRLSCPEERKKIKLETTAAFPDFRSQHNPPQMSGVLRPDNGSWKPYF
ncbi:hypothetical protein TNIN_107891 [Trichonephila inaurata madagascariensis]|uniref:Uncharacterized protein n=1 Tax=Trichonephila inaurata madagascariensis TaxID=2747483 RepID=A0A8X6YLL0_9ARAC|nr:hypothetical protein TNIN_107891 [Trichonephila inaurata madagascariensis]